jgi:hypothetical protein
LRERHFASGASGRASLRSARWDSYAPRILAAPFFAEDPLEPVELMLRAATIRDTSRRDSGTDTGNGSYERRKG